MYPASGSTVMNYQNGNSRVFFYLKIPINTHVFWGTKGIALQE
jgi:hypothetical protein